MSDDASETNTEKMLTNIFNGFGLSLRDMLKDTNIEKRKRRSTRKFLKNKND